MGNNTKQSFYYSITLSNIYVLQRLLSYLRKKYKISLSEYQVVVEIALGRFKHCRKNQSFYHSLKFKRLVDKRNAGTRPKGYIYYLTAEGMEILRYTQKFLQSQVDTTDIIEKNEYFDN